MKTFQSIPLIVVLGFATGVIVRASTRAPQLPPETVVANLYKQHKKASPFFQTRSRAILDKYFDKQLADLLWKDANTKREEVGALEGDPLYNAQDMEIKNFVIGKAAITGKTAKLKVTFVNFDKNEEIGFDLVLTVTGWKISNLTYSDGTTLVGLLKQG